MLNRFFFLFLCAITTGAYAQQILPAQQRKATCNPELLQYIKQNNNPGEVLNLLVRGNIQAIENAVKQAGGIVKYSVGSISAIRIRTSEFKIILNNSGIQRIEGYSGNGTTLDDQTDIHTRADSVKMGAAPLLKSYTGKGVVVGIIDSGIEIEHPDFQDSDGNTRIKFIWDQNATSGGTSPTYGYGQVWSAAEIDGGTCTHVEESKYFGHGSNVTGAAAGNGLALNKFAGVAPDADIISVACRFDANFLNNVADAVKFIYDNANDMSKPCVINASVGTYSGSHDGTDLAAQMIDTLITMQNGRSLVASAGNAGGVPSILHLGYNVEADSAFTWFRYEPTIQRVYFQVWADKEEFNNVQFKLGADLPAGGNFKPRVRTRYYNISADFDLSSGIDSLKDTLYVNNKRIGRVELYAYSYNDSTYQLSVQVFPDSTNYLWRFTTQGSGYFDVWSNPLVNGTSGMKTTGMPTALAYPDIARYRYPDLSQSIVSSFQCSDKVITVGNFHNRSSFTNYNNTTTTFTDTTGALSLSSSIGPTRDGRIKPDIAAPGGNTLAPGQLSTLAQMKISEPNKVAEGGLHNVNGGTSMSSPVAAGVIALYLEKNPNASWSEIKNAMLTTAIQDTFTGNNLPDNRWGYGKINAFGMLKSSLIYGCTDSSGENYNPLAEINDGTCEYDTIKTGITSSLNNIEFASYPNPVQDVVHFSYNLNKAGAPYTMQVTDAGGRIITTLTLTNYKGIITYNTTSLAGGAYFIKLVNNGKTLRTLKLLKL